jgi:hypothetical protein
MKYIGILLLVIASKNGFTQNYFEGEIIYRFEAEKKDSAFDLGNIISYPAKQSIFYFKNGNWINELDAGMIEYQYFNYNNNLQLYKIRGLDTLLYNSYAKRTQDQDSVISITDHEKTDTILGRVCNRLVLRTAEMTLTLIYCPDLRVDPSWFKNSKGGYYDIIYGRTKSLYLVSIIETNKFISKCIATDIKFKKISDEFFPDIDKLPMKEL